MCIRDSARSAGRPLPDPGPGSEAPGPRVPDLLLLPADKSHDHWPKVTTCLLYTSDAADDM
eukprot:8351197-Alexandrium_andersonii.AAC.1